jgi:hypothetical protein
VPIPASIGDLSQTPASNFPLGSEPLTTADDYFRTYAGFIAELRDRVPAVSDFSGATDADKFAALEAQINGGIAVVPNASYSLGSFELSADGKYVNDSDTLLSTPLFNVGETPGSTTTRHLTLGSFLTPNLNKKRFVGFDRLESTGAGSTVALTGTGDFTRGINAHKKDYSLSPSDGEVGSLYLTVRQGGASATKNDASAILADLATYSDSFICYSEAAVAKINGASTITDKVRVISGFLNKGTADMGGQAVIVEAGTASNLIYAEISSGATADKLLKFVDLAGGIYNPNIFAFESDGLQTTFMRNALTSTLGDSITTRSMNVGVGNRDEIRERVVRTTGGLMSFSTSEWRIERVIDNATITGGVYLGYDATQGHKVAFGSNGTPLLQATSNLYMGFNGATPMQRPVMPVNASDLATAIALVNFIKASLVSYGLAQ